ncbi:hypothetical protein THTE_0970 [Thermogutta terrifontis]|uniref:Uncharacterized protein n=1 Tax=Thermogutta terrifontis TaxID=1331910 RepID=A0A286RC84_9BACT|nr:hypothetical protein THTE_0970 [Thermogutta terrifontis]
MFSKKLFDVGPPPPDGALAQPERLGQFAGADKTKHCATGNVQAFRQLSRGKEFQNLSLHDSPPNCNKCLYLSPAR